MYKIEKGNNSLCGPFQDHFEDIWNDESSVESISFIKHEYAETDNNLTKCSNCQCKDICKDLKLKYLTQIEGIENSPTT